MTETEILEPYQLTTTPPRSKRTEKLLELSFSAPPTIGIERAKLVTESYQKTEGMPVIMRRALADDHIFSNMTVFIEPYTLIVGNQTECGPGKHAPLFPDINDFLYKEFVEREPCYPWEREKVMDWFKVPGPGPNGDTEKFLNEIQPILTWWRGKTAGEYAYRRMSDDTIAAGSWIGPFIFTLEWYIHSGDGHFCVDFPYILKYGLKENIRRCEEKLAHFKPWEPDAVEKRATWEANIIASKALIKWARRYAQLAREKAATENDPGRKQELLQIAENCDWVPENPARTFWEAVQVCYFLHLAVQIEDSGQSISYGRFDQYLYPYYEKDLKEGKITKEFAQQLVDNIYIKTWQINKWRAFHESSHFRGYVLHQNLTVGGSDGFGNDLTNELTYIAMQAKDNTRQTEPQLTARWHNKAPHKYLIKCAELIRLGIGQPAMFNDHCIIPAMQWSGYSYEEAADYGIVGCTEPHVHGLNGGNLGGPIFNFSKVLELTLFNGVDPRSGVCLHRNINGKDLSTFESFNQLWKATLDQFAYAHKLMTEHQHAAKIAYMDLVDEPLVAALVCPEDTIEGGKSVNKGGSRYNWHTYNLGALATAADSLAAIKKLVFDDKVITGAQLQHALETNYEDETTNPTGPEIRAMLVASPKYGNDDDYVDKIAADLLHFNILEARKYKAIFEGSKGNFVNTSSNSVSVNTPWGISMGATPDGRNAGLPTAECVSPNWGELGPKKGPTAVVNSVSKLPNVLVSGGQLVNYKFIPQDLKDEAGLRKFLEVIRTAFNQNCFHMQFNVVSAETLRNAQKNPVRYKNLIVRVAGYSAYFVQLDRGVQEDIIRRIELRI